MNGEVQPSESAHEGSDSQRPRVWPEYLKTQEAAEYLRKSASWLVKRNDIPYLRGVPNVYRRRDLDQWFDRNVFKPFAR